MARPGPKLRFDTPEERRIVHEKYCEHLSQGFSKESFPFAGRGTMADYISRFPEDFPDEEIQLALACSQYEWEKMGMLMAKGEVQNASAASWIFNMKNRFGWSDKKQISGPGDGPIPLAQLSIDIKKYSKEDLQKVKEGFAVLRRSNAQPDSLPQPGSD